MSYIYRIKDRSYIFKLEVGYLEGLINGRFRESE